MTTTTAQSNNGTVIITGSTGFIGSALIHKLAGRYALVGFDRAVARQPPPAAECVCIDLTSEKAIAAGLDRIRTAYSGRIASVIHLAAYFDLTGQPNPLYDEITVQGTQKLLHALQLFEVEQFVFASTMLVHAPTRPGQLINETSPLDPKLPYRESKIRAERLIHEQRGSIPAVFVRPTGVYDDLCRAVYLAQQIARIYERQLISTVYPGDLNTGQSYLHLDDLTEALLRIVQRRKDLPPELPVLLGEPEALSFGELQRMLGRLIHNEEWPTRQVPKAIAKAGAWLEDEVFDEDPFIRPWMVDSADDHYELDISRARQSLDWEPKHSLRQTLPEMIAALKADPPGWYRANKLNAARVAGQAVNAYHPRQTETTDARDPVARHEMMRKHHDMMREMHFDMLWAQFLVVALGAWLLTSPFQFALFDPAAAASVRDVTQERGLWDGALRNALIGGSDIISGLVLVLFGLLALSPRFAWAQWGTTLVGLWLLFAPLVFWTPSAAATMNDTIVGALAITFSVLVPMMPGMSHEGMMDKSTVPPGWSYSPSTWLQRLPMIGLGLFGFLIARYLTAYQLGHIGAVWDPFFSGEGGKNGTEYIITSDVSRAWPIADAGLGAAAYMIEALMGAMGTATRWRTMPWMVTFFFILVVPLGGISIFFIIIQPVIIGTYCTLCLIAALAMLIMIPLTLDEVVAMGQYMLRSVGAGRPFWRTFFRGGPDPLARVDTRYTGFEAPISKQVSAASWGVTLPWTLLASCVLGAWLMFSRMTFATAGAIANNEHVIGALVITIAICAMAEVARPLRFLNLLFGLWMLAAPLLLAGAHARAVANDMLTGLLLIALSLPRGARSPEHYGAWDHYVV
jgi:nucleoside-diphosphate-sugar epimerase